MADPILSKIISVKCGEANVGEFVIIRNLTRGGQLTAALKGSGTNREAIFNPAPKTQWREKDLIQAEIRGRLQGVKQEKIQAGGTTIRITGVTDTSTPGVSL